MAESMLEQAITMAPEQESWPEDLANIRTWLT
jgi:hypothetical protein